MNGNPMNKVTTWIAAIMAAFGLMAASVGGYWRGQVDIAAALGDRPTRQEVHQSIQEIREEVQYHLREIHDDLRIIRQDVKKILQEYKKGNP